MCGCTCPALWRSGWFLCLQCVCVHTTCGGQDNLCVYCVCGGGMPHCVEVRKSLCCVYSVCVGTCVLLWRSGRLCYVYNVCENTCHAVWRSEGSLWSRFTLPLAHGLHRWNLTPGLCSKHLSPWSSKHLVLTCVLSNNWRFRCSHLPSSCCRLWNSHLLTFKLHEVKGTS